MGHDRALNVGIVGGGPGCKAIMAMIFREKLKELRMNLIGVASTNTDAVGYLYAKEKGLYATRDYRDLYKLEDLNMIIELTGRDKVAAEISLNKPDHVRLMDHVAARLFWDLFQIEEDRISERGEAEAALSAAEREKTAILGALVEHVVHQDTDLKILWANRAACESAGLSLQEILGRHCYEIWAQREDICPDCPVAIAIKTGRTQEIEKWTPDGRAWYVRGHPMRDEEGSIVGAVEVTLEITERRRAQEALRESERELSTVFSSVRDGIVVLDEKGEITKVNRSVLQASGYAQKDLIGQPFQALRFFDSDSVSKMEAAFSLGIEGIESAPFEAQLRTKEGEKLHLDILSSPLRGDENIVGVVAILRNVSARKIAVEERRVLEARLQQAQKMEAIGTLAGGIAHDFNNVLMGIQGHISMMVLQMDSTHPHLRHIKGIEESIQNGASLTKQLLGFARGGKYEVKATDLNELIEKSCEMFGRTRKEISMHTRYQTDIWAVEVDWGQIEQVLLNLFFNAWQAMPQGGDLYVDTAHAILDDDYTKPFGAAPGNYVRISVTDTGVGMDNATRQRIFDPFFTTKEMGRGTGLGLASAYGIIQNHGGIIDVDSEQGKGATFTIYLPASEKTIPPKEKRLTDDILKGTETLLLVDDEDKILDVGREILKEMGYKVLIARNGKEAVEIFNEHKDTIDLVILDMIMPEMGGGEAYDRIRVEAPEVKVLLSSGYSIDGQASEILERGCDGFIQKPFKMKELSMKIREILGR
ncbi:MAG: PAS domain S-box protein [Deltaproteobacteria bacterium]|nr:PAS domain S-box protein [Deltaproteobacteria bacterium]